MTAQVADKESEAWLSHNRDAAKRFISNIVFIDDQPRLQAPAHDAPAQVAQKDKSEDEAFGVSTAPDAPASEDADPSTSNSQLVSSVEMPNRADIDEELHRHDLRVRPLTSAFAGQGIASSFFFPETDEQADLIVDQAEALASQADIAVLDWHLRDAKPDLTIDIIKRILASDIKRGGRLRLICIYTGEALETGIVGLLKADLAETVELALSGDYALTAEHLRIIVLNKLDVPPTDFPGRVIEEFAILTQGLMSSFALNAISVLRNNTKQLLKVFSEDLDPAMVSHRIHLADSDDAESFGLDLLLMQLKSVLSTSMVHRDSLSVDCFKLWIDQNISDGATWDVGGEIVDKELAKTLVGSSYEGEFLRARGTLAEQILVKWQSRVQGLPFEDQEKMGRCAGKLARLSKLVRQREGESKFPDNWRPTLGLGSVLKCVRKDGNVSYFFCAQPLCDSVRLTAPTVFPLLKLSGRQSPGRDEEGELSFIEDPSAYWMAVCDQGKTLTLQLKPVPKHGKYIKFRISKAEKRALAIKQENGDYEFATSDKSDCNYYWLADVEPLQAQRALNSMAAMASRVGVDEYEVLRRGMPGIL